MHVHRFHRAALLRLEFPDARARAAAAAAAAGLGGVDTPGRREHTAARANSSNMKPALASAWAAVAHEASGVGLPAVQEHAENVLRRSRPQMLVVPPPQLCACIALLFCACTWSVNVPVLVRDRSRFLDAAPRGDGPRRPLGRAARAHAAGAACRAPLGGARPPPSY